MRSRIESWLERFGKYTAVPADLIAILSVLLKLLISIDLAPSIEFSVVEGVPIWGGLTYVAVIYGFIATFYMLKRQLRDDAKIPPTKKSLSIVLETIRLISASIPAFLGILLSISFITFGILTPRNGLAIVVISGILIIKFFRNWNAGEYSAETYRSYASCKYWYRAGNIDFLIWVPAVWVCFLIAPHSHWLVDVFWALIYSSVGYIVSILIPLLLISYFNWTLDWESYYTGKIQHSEFEDFITFGVIAIIFLIAISILLGSFVFSIVSPFLPAWLFWILWATFILGLIYLLAKALRFL